MNTSLTDAAFRGDVSEVERRLDAGEDVNAVDGVWNPLHAAIENSHLACIDLIVSRGADIERVCAELTPLAHAVDVAIDGTVQSGGRAGDEPTAVIARLLAAGAAPAPALKVARKYDSDKIAQLLMTAMAGSS